MKDMSKTRDLQKNDKRWQKAERSRKLYADWYLFIGNPIYPGLLLLCPQSFLGDHVHVMRIYHEWAMGAVNYGLALFIISS